MPEIIWDWFSQNIGLILKVTGGVLIAVIGLFIQRSSRSQVQKGGRNSVNTQVGGDLKINISKDSDNANDK